MGQVVDTETALEFMRETLEKVDAAELAAITADAEKKSAWFARTLAADAIDSMTERDQYTVLRSVFAIGRRATSLQAAWPLEDFRGRLGSLLHGDGDPAVRFGAFVDDPANAERLDENARRDLASEVLHFAAPDRHWLWTRWMWDPTTRTGALPLVTTVTHDLHGTGNADTYLRVGEAVAFVHENGPAAGFQTFSRSVFGTDVFLSCVYTIYVYTVLKMRMTQEFNQVMPLLPEFSRRLLGVYRPRAKGD